MQGLKVKCKSCGQIRHETTDKYDPDVRPNGAMVRLINPWKDWHWDCFDEAGQGISTTPCSMMVCPGCAAPLCPSGRLTVLPKEEPVEAPKSTGFVCETCGRPCKTLAGLKAHERSHKKRKK